eukprot:TRINITY_DN59988_c0_g1_i1.p1 TRINITY_DN59988_c0_g1~~TRINITY_DN59988_c0_g1_i1.p1  ORF type:complete len:452 (-),score=106.27 TRINITY_DN59988_c0_g1_i1:47-1402(-)
MISRTSDQHTLNTLRALHHNGMLGAELDDQIAADLLDGTSSHSKKSSISDPFGGRRKETPPGRLEPLRLHPRIDSPDLFRSGTDVDKGAQITGDYMKQLAADCEQFNTKLQDNNSTIKEQMLKALIDLFVRTAKDKLPDSFLRSLPKFGKGANKMNGIFTRSLNRRKTDNMVDRREVPFELLIQDDVLDEMGKDIALLIDQEMKRAFSVVTSDMQRILKSVVSLKDRLETLEEDLLKEQTEMRVLKEKLSDSAEQTKELLSRIEQLNQQAREKEIQMDILSDQVKRRNQMLDEQQSRFHREVMRYKTTIYELKHKLNQQDPGPRRQSFTLDMDLGPAQGQVQDSIEVMEAVDSATRELREQMLETIRKLKQDHAKEKKELAHQKKLAVDERDNEIYHLKMNIKSMDRIIEVEKRRLMKNRELELKEIQEKYEEKIAALQSEISELKKRVTN